MLPTPPGLEAALADRYTFRSVLGAGGTSTVYRARDEKHGRDVAIKVLRPELAASLARQRFAREAEIIAKLQHPHILSLIESGSAADTYYFVMPLVEGSTLRERLDEGPALTIGETTRILADLADALAYAHDHDVVHRDIKPSNVLLTGRHALLMDFGVAKGLLDGPDAQLTVGIALGTPSYMSPEQAMALPTVDHRADLYALGVLGYELLVGSPPFTGGAPQDILAAHVSRTPEDVNALREDIPEGLGEIVMRCLEKDPEARWPDASTMVTQLDELITPSGGITPVSGTPAQAVKPFWRRPVVALPAATVVIAGAAILSQRGASPTSVMAHREQVTFVGNVIESAISADGQWLAYITSDAEAQRLFVRDLSATTALELDHATEIGGLMWSGDGSQIAYHSSDGRSGAVLRAVPRLGGPGEVLGTGHAFPSPDLKRRAAFSPSARFVRLIDREPADTVRFEIPEWVLWTTRVAWSPDSRRVAIEVGNRDQVDYALLVTTQDGALVEAIRDSARVTEPSFSRDGRFLYYLYQSGGELPDLMRMGIAVDGRPGSDPELVFRAFDGDLRADFYYSEFMSRATHTDSGEIVYVRTEGQSNIWAFDVDDLVADPERVTTGSAFYSNVRASPDGERLAVVRATRFARTIGVMSSAGGPLQPIISSFLIDGDVAWSTSGERLAMTWSLPGTGVRLSIHDFESASTRVVDTETTGFNLAWAGARLVAQAPGNRNLLLVDPESGDARVVVSDSIGFNFFQSVSPDLQSIAYFKRRGEASGVWVQGLDNPEPARHVLAEELNPLRYSEDGDWLYAADNGLINGPQRVVRLSMTSSDVDTVLVVPADYLVRDITADGSTVLAIKREWQGDVWRLSPTPN